MSSVVHRPLAGVGWADRTVSGATFFVYCLYLTEYFLHISARIPAIGTMRPTLLLALLLAFMLIMQKDKLEGRFRSDPVARIKTLLIYIAVSLPLVTWPGSVLNNLSEFIKALSFFFFTIAVLDTPGRFRKAVGLFMVLQIFRVLEPLFLNLTEGYWGSSTYLGTDDGFAQRLAGAPSDVINSNGLGFVIVTIIPFIHFLWFQSERKILKLLYLALLPLLLYALVLTMSRGSFLTLLLVMFIIFRQSRYKARMVLAGISAALMAWLFVLTPVQKDRYLSIFTDDAKQSATAQGRIAGMIEEFKLGLERPLVGHGLGTEPEAKYHSLGKRQAAHNLYAELLIELGLIGMVIFIRYMVSIYRLLKTAMQKIRHTSTMLDRMPKIFWAVYWMYVLYSANYWGLSQYYWYLLGGLVVAWSNIQASADPEDGDDEQNLGRHGSGSYREEAAV